MQEHKVILTWEAIYDVTDIAEYIEAEFGQDRADRFQLDIDRQLEHLEYVGTMLGKTDLLYRGYPIYKKVFSPSIIFYILKEPEKEIHVLRVLREERDWEKVMALRQEYEYP